MSMLIDNGLEEIEILTVRGVMKHHVRVHSLAPPPEDHIRRAPRLVLNVRGLSRTKQEFAAETDINNIVDRVQKTHNPVPVTGTTLDPRFGDFSQGSDFSEHMESLRFAQELFAELPSKIRARFGHNPASIIDFLEDADNRAEAVQLGLLTEPEPADPSPAEPTPPLPAESPPGPS